MTEINTPELEALQDEYVESLEALFTFMSDVVDMGRLKEVDMPREYATLVKRIRECDKRFTRKDKARRDAYKAARKSIKAAAEVGANTQQFDT